MTKFEHAYMADDVSIPVKVWEHPPSQFTAFPKQSFANYTTL